MKPIPKTVVKILDLPVVNPESGLQKPREIKATRLDFLRGKYGTIRFPDLYINEIGVSVLGAGRFYFNTPNVNTFRGLTSYFLYDLFEEEFFKAEELLPAEEQHPVVIWMRLIKKSESKNKVEKPLIETGDTLCWAMLGYQLYLAYEHSNLPESVIARLKKGSQFQGARFEILVAAVMIVAGYEVSWIENSEIGKTVEFVATHKQTGAKFAVEAKSRHRPGVLAKGAEDVPEPPLRADLQTLISRGLSKNPDLPLLIFVEANTPFRHEEVKEAMEHEIDMAWGKKIDRKSWDAKGGFPAVGLIISNDTTWWNIGKPIEELKNANWLKCYDSPNRHNIDAGPYLHEIARAFEKSGRIPVLTWKNTKTDR